MPILIGIDRVKPLFEAAKPRVLLIDVSPIGFKNPVGDLSMTGYGYPFLDFVPYVSAVAKHRLRTKLETMGSRELTTITRAISTILEIR